MNIFNIYKSVLIFAIVITAISSCKKDLGNYEYKDINEVKFINIDTINGYNIYLGETLDIVPELEGTIDKNLSGEYTYEWRIMSGVDYFFTEDGKDIVIANTRDLHYPITLYPGTYPIGLYVTDKKTGVTFIRPMKLNVVTPFYEGWLVLNKVNNSSRLDFISFMNDEFTIHKDLLATLNSGIPAVGSPYQVLYYGNLGGVCLLTSEGAAVLDRESYKYLPASDLSKKIYGNPPSDFRAAQLYYSNNGSPWEDNVFMYGNDGNMYKQGYGYFGYDIPLNTDANTSQRFNISPYFANSSGYNGKLVMYNTDEKMFYYVTKLNVLNYSTAREVEAELNFPAGKDLVYMSDNDVLQSIGTNAAYAILKDPGIDKFYMLRFNFENDFIRPVNYFEEITATDFALAEHYAISPDLGYLFYNVGGKIYEYDLFLKTSKLMIDKGSEKISLLVFDTNPKPEQWKNSLMVGSFNPAGTEGENGTLTQYTVPPVNGNLVQQNQWTGMGEVVSISYRFR